jgi:hypothetical protein
MYVCMYVCMYVYMHRAIWSKYYPIYWDQGSGRFRDKPRNI